MERENFEQRYVMIESDNGRRQALVRTRLEPGVQGVVIICEGAGDVFVRSRVINVVTTALNISSARVSVEKIKS
jgi:stage III sporulation protein AG